MICFEGIWSGSRSGRFGWVEGVCGSDVLLIICTSLWHSSGGIDPCVDVEVLHVFLQIWSWGTLSLVMMPKAMSCL